jgi:subtilisin family serine protease
MCGAGTHGFHAILKTCNPLDDNTHGSHVSGTIGALGNNNQGVVGVNWTASIMALKFLSAAGIGLTSDAIDAIEFGIQAKAAFAAINGANIRVLSNSWGGGGFSQALSDEIGRANQNNILFVAAAGNDGANIDSTPTYPASYGLPNIVAVAATDNQDNIASFSNYGAAHVHLGAPGVNVLSTIIATYEYLSGTSMATPHVSGAALLVLSKCALDTAGLKANLLNNVDPIPSMSGVTVTGGRLNVNKAIRACAPP